MTDNKEKKIAVLMPFFGDGGMERSVINLAEGLIAEGVRVDLVLFKEGYGSLRSEVPGKVNVVEFRAKSFFSAIPPLFRYLLRERHSPALSLSTPVNLISILASIFVKIITGTGPKIIASTQVAIKTDASTTRLKARLRPLAYRAYNFADTAHAVSLGVAKDLEGFGVKKNKIKVIYNPIISAGLEKKSGEPVPHPWFEDKADNSPIVIGVGRLVPQKDFPNLLRAFALARKARPMRLLILGEGEGRPGLEGLARDLGIWEGFSLPGFSNNPYAYMKHADLFVLSSAWEGFGNVLAEAMALGTPVVSTLCPHGPLEILENGRYGPLVPVGDPEALSKAMLETLDKPYPPEHLKQGALRFTIDKVTEEYMKVTGIK